MSHRRRSRRSASAPPSGANRPMGMKAAAATSPVQAGCPVRAYTSTPRATVCIHVPTLDTNAADQMRAKFRDRSGRSEARATERPYRAPTGRMPPRTDGTAGRARPGEWLPPVAAATAGCRASPCAAASERTTRYWPWWPAHPGRPWAWQSCGNDRTSRRRYLAQAAARTLASTHHRGTLTVPPRPLQRLPPPLLRGPLIGHPEAHNSAFLRCRRAVHEAVENEPRHPEGRVESSLAVEEAKAVTGREVLDRRRPDQGLHGGVDHARCQRVGPQSVTPFLPCHHLGEHLDGGFGRAVRCPSLVRGRCRSRRDVDELATSGSGPHMAGEGRRSVRHTEDVDVDVSAHSTGIGIGQGADRLQHTGVVHPQVDAAEALDHTQGEPVQGLGVADIDRRRPGLGPLRRGRLVAGTEPQTETFAGKRRRHSRAEAAAGPGDDGDQLGGDIGNRHVSGGPCTGAAPRARSTYARSYAQIPARPRRA